MKRKKSPTIKRADARAIRVGEDLIPAPKWKKRAFITSEITGRRIQEPAPRRLKNAFNAKGAFGGPKKRAARLAAIATSQRQGVEISKDRQLKRAYADFYATKEGREFARKFGRSYADSSPRRSLNGSADVDFHDPADLPQASVIDNPIDHIEPQTIRAELGDLDPDEIDFIGETFKHSFRWALDGADLVEKGKRCNIAIARMRPDLGAGLSIDPALAKKFDRGFRKEDLEKAGIWYGRVLEWLRRGDPISARGERVYLLAYVLWPSLIDARTLASLGGMTGKTRQAKDKLVNCLRDTLSGLKALAMRGDITRARCRQSQLGLADVAEAACGALS